MAIMDLYTSLQTIINERSAKKVRQSIHDGIFRANQVVDANKNLVDQVTIRQDAVEDFNTQVIQEMTDKDVISAPEIIASRGGEDVLADRLDRDFDYVTDLIDVRTKGSVSIDEFGALGDFNFDLNVGTDNTPMILSALDTLSSEGTLIIPEGQYYVTGHIPIHCNVECRGSLIIPNNLEKTFITFPREETINLKGSDLFSSLSRGQLAIDVKTTSSLSVEALLDYTFTFHSQEKLIDRLGSDRYTPYTKNETGEFKKLSNGRVVLKTRLLYTYNDLDNLDITLSRKMKRKVINNLSVIRASIGDNKHNQKVMVVRGNNLEMNGFRFDNQSGSFSDCLRLEDASNIHLNNTRIKNVDGPDGDTYAIVNSTSSYIHIDDYSYDASYETSARGYAARHGNYVYFTNCETNGVDDHYGHNYFIKNCKIIESGINFAGENFSIQDSEFYRCFSVFSVRADTPNVEGSLLFDNVKFYGCTRLVEYRLQVSDPLGRTYSTDLHFFDSIEFRNCIRTDTFKYSDRTYGESAFINTSTIGGTYTSPISTGSIRVIDCDLDVAMIKLRSTLSMSIDEILFRNIDGSTQSTLTTNVLGGFIHIEGYHILGSVAFEHCKNGGLYSDTYSFPSPSIKEINYLYCVFNTSKVSVLNDTVLPTGSLTYDSCVFDDVQGHNPRGFLLHLENNKFKKVNGYTLTSHLQGTGKLVYSQNNILGIGINISQVPVLTGYIDSEYYKQI